jgi:hypothetical protein
MEREEEGIGVAAGWGHAAIDKPMGDRTDLVPSGFDGDLAGHSFFAAIRSAAFTADWCQGDREERYQQDRPWRLYGCVLSSVHGSDRRAEHSFERSLIFPDAK